MSRAVSRRTPLSSTEGKSGTVIQSSRGSRTGREWVAVVNPSSGSNSTSKNLGNLETLLHDVLGEDLTLLVSRRKGDLRSYTRQAIAEGAGTVIAVGGDGTANEVANAFFESRATRSATLQTSMALIPSGTRNVLAKSLGLPTELPEAIARIKESTPRPLDLIQASTTKTIDSGRSPSGAKGTMATSTVLLNAAEIGVGAVVSKRSKKIRSHLKSRPISTAASLLATIPTFRSSGCRVSIDNGSETLTENITMCVVANGSMIGGGFEPAPLADPSDGLMDISIVKESGGIKLLAKLAKMKIGDLYDDDDLFYSRARRASFLPTDRNREITVTADGELIGKLPAKFEIVPGALKFCY